MNISSRRFTLYIVWTLYMSFIYWFLSILAKANMNKDMIENTNNDLNMYLFAICVYVYKQIRLDDGHGFLLLFLISGTIIKINFFNFLFVWTNINVFTKISLDDEM